jgi:tripartite-type tricarboxylate transporter receptor subunit TctC
MPRPADLRAGLLGLAAGAAMTLCGGANAAESSDFYSGKQLTWILSAGAGGGYSTYAQAFAPYLTKYLPGNPKVVVQNMPGAGGLRAMQYLSVNAPKDGTVIGLVHSSVPFAPLFGLPGSTFDPRKFGWIGSLNAAGELCVAWHTSGINTWQDMKDKTFIVGGTGGGSQMETLPDAINRLFGARIKIVSGYGGGSEVNLAIERGEIQGRCSVSVSSINATRPDWFASKKVAVPIQVALRRSTHFPDVPALIELAPDKRTHDILQVLLAYQDMDRPMLAPPGVPPDRLELLRTAFHAGITDPAFLAEAQRLGLEIEEVSGKRLEEIVTNAYGLPPDILGAARDAISVGGQTK